MTVRPLRLPDDFDVMVDVIVESFQYPENPNWSVQDDEKQSITTQLSAVRRMWPLLRLITTFYPSFRDQMTGLVWDEGDDVAGLVLYQPTALMGGAAWIISTVGVLPSHRRRGIGRRLVEEALSDMQQRSVESVRLQVLSGNAPAYELYRSLGFEQYSAGTEVDREPDLPGPKPAQLPEGYGLATLGRWEWQPRYGLAKRITPSAVTEYEPVDRSDYLPPLPLRILARLLDRLSGTSDVAVAVYRDRSTQTEAGPLAENIVAVGRSIARAKPGGVNQISIMLDPSAPELAAFLVRHAVSEIVERSPGRRISLSLPEWQRPVLDAALDAGFNVRRESHDLGMKLSPRGL